MTYRVGCRFNPAAKRAGGGDRMGPRQARGAWVVYSCYEICGSASELVVTGLHGGLVGLLSTTPRRVGTRVSPRKLLATWQDHQRWVRDFVRITKEFNRVAKTCRWQGA